jgi:hypothetical protein
MSGEGTLVLSSVAVFAAACPTVGALLAAVESPIIREGCRLLALMASGAHLSEAEKQLARELRLNETLDRQMYGWR